MLRNSGAGLPTSAAQGANLSPCQAAVVSTHSNAGGTPSPTPGPFARTGSRSLQHELQHEVDTRPTNATDPSAPTLFFVCERASEGQGQGSLVPAA